MWISGSTGFQLLLFHPIYERSNQGIILLVSLFFDERLGDAEPFLLELIFNGNHYTSMDIVK
jgi:hypothetical protein